MDIPHSGPPPPRPKRDDAPKGLPLLPFTVVPPMHSRQNSHNDRPVSSVYSQQSPSAFHDQFPYNTYAKPMTPDTADVSPPSSPELDGHRSNANRYQDHEVSPIDEIPDVSRLGFGKTRENENSNSRLKPPSSSIPVMRREKRRNQVAAAAANLLARKDAGDGSKGRKTADVRWDPYSGEQTTSEKGKPQSVKPGEFSTPGHPSIGKMGNTSIISAAPKPQMSFGERVRKLKSNAPIEKPEWKGATGRTTIVPTPTDNYDMPPLKIPPRSEKRITSRTNTPASSVQSPASETKSASSYLDLPGTLSVNAGQSSGGRNSPQTFIEPSQLSQSDYVSQDFQDYTSAENHYKHAQKDSTGTIERNFREALKNSFPPIDPNEPYVQPPSRFSISTRATSEATQSTRAPSLDLTNSETMHPPMPIQAYTMTTQGPSSILNRKRPKVASDSPTPSSNSNSKSVTRKAVNSSTPITISMTSSIAPPPRTTSFTSTSYAASMKNTKSLPNTPAEAQSHDLISTLEAKLEALAHRRQNIERSIKAMTELMPADKIIMTEEVRRKREVEKKQIEGLREEEAEIRKEEHEVGLKLHRAWKRRDKDTVYEPTGLWVRRVTG
ncbi:hypothetical protein CJF30_00003766 [Rutstroemia sp. NJR-2017a BBW]|nr:hypothetical protein CJF30_00003766 [Rutstroemia sp. NJR-2017a BBW]